MDREDLLKRFRELQALLAEKEIDSDPEPDEEPAEDVQHHTPLISACKLPGFYHSKLIPWYTTGFQ